MEIWGGIECSINRVAEQYFSQLCHQGFYHRKEDLELLVQLGIKKIRFPILWEKHQEEANQINWHNTADHLNYLRQHNVDVIAGLVHHGSGPKYVQMTDDSFAIGLSEYAKKVAEKFPWINHYTPINEPLTTARFCGLYGLWYPHGANEKTFLKILVNECKATILAMHAIREVNPEAKLVHTEDLGRTYSTEMLAHQANFENERRWLGIDLLCGNIDRNHIMFNHLINNGITEQELDFFSKHAMPPDVLGFNHYITSERYLDEKMDRYPSHLHGGNGKQQYADVEAIRVAEIQPYGIKAVLKEAWNRYKLPLAITEAHLFCGREDQLRWLAHVHNEALALKAEGVDIRAVTAWSLFGAHGWDSLLTAFPGSYENGAFDTSSGKPRPTAVAEMITSLAHSKNYSHPALNGKGWWQTDKRIIYPAPSPTYQITQPNSPPVLIIGARGTLGNAFAKACKVRDINFVALTRDQLDLLHPTQVELVIKKYKPWAVINAAGFVNVDAAEIDEDLCFQNNAMGPKILATYCKKLGVKLVTFSSDLVFDGTKNTAYMEDDAVNPLNSYGRSKAFAEQNVLEINPQALVIRTSSFFSPWDKYNFIHQTLKTLQQKTSLTIPGNVYISPTYVPDLVDRTIDLMIDGEQGIWHLTNEGTLTWFDLAKHVAERAGFQSSLLVSAKIEDMKLKAKRPLFSALKSNRGVLMPTLECALDRFFSNWQQLHAS